MQIAHISSSLASEVNKLKIDPKTASKSTDKPSGDAAELSKDGQKLSQTNTDINTAKTQAENQPDIRSWKVEEVKEKIKSGFYDTEAFAGELAEKLIKDFGLE